MEIVYGDASQSIATLKDPSPQTILKINHTEPAIMMMM